MVPLRGRWRNAASGPAHFTSPWEDRLAAGVRRSKW